MFDFILLIAARYKRPLLTFFSRCQWNIEICFCNYSIVSTFFSLRIPKHTVSTKHVELFSKDGHFRIPNPEGSESQTIRKSICDVNRIIGFLISLFYIATKCCLELFFLIDAFHYYCWFGAGSLAK